MDSKRSKYRVEIIKSKTRKLQPYRWRIVSRNGRVLCHSETYSNKGDAKGIVVSLLAAIVSDDIAIVETKE